VKQGRNEDGFTMIVTVLGASLVVLLALVAVAAVNGDAHLTTQDLVRKQAYEAARAGIEDYTFHLNEDTGYWAKCTNVTPPGVTESSAVNQVGAVAKGTAKTRPVPGNTGSRYAIELIPAEGQKECEPANATTSMIESTSSMQGTFRIRSTGFAGKAQVSITATFKSASFLDFVYFTQLETLDPATYGYPESAAQWTGVTHQCEKTYQEGRNEIPYYETKDSQGHILEQKFCVKIDFVNKDVLNGPVHTNDTMAICEKPTFGRNAQDMVEISASFPGWYDDCPGHNSKPNFKGTPITGVGELKPPKTDEKLKQIAEPGFSFKGQVKICLEGTRLTIGNGATCTEGTEHYSGPFPANGVIYVANGTGVACSSTYSPFTASYPAPSECGNAYVHGKYSGQLTIGTENDIIVDGPTCWSSTSPCPEKPVGNEMLGLIANNFVRVFHEYPNEAINPTTYAVECKSLQTGQTERKLENLTIDAAILSLNHSFIVDHYDCGSSLGTVTVRGAIAQKFRGPVGQGSDGYQAKSYNYDDRLRYQEPPSFIEPEKLPWLIGRETIG
jgi:hypothetical protein